MTMHSQSIDPGLKSFSGLPRSVRSFVAIAIPRPRPAKPKRALWGPRSLGISKNTLLCLPDAPFHMLLQNFQRQRAATENPVMEFAYVKVLA